MPKNRDFNHLDPFPASWTDGIQEFVGEAAINFALTPLNATTLRGVAGVNDGQASLGITGKWRYRTTNHDVAHPGGAAGVWDIWAIASDNEFTGIDTDNTDYNWYLVIKQGVAPTGNTPAAKPIAVTRLIGQVDWSGTAITGIRQYVGTTDSRAPIHPTAPLPAVPAVRARAAAAQTANVFQTEDSAGVVKLGINNAGSISLPTGQGLTSAGSLVFTALAANAIQFLQGATEISRFNSAGDFVMGPARSVGWSAVAGTGTLDTSVSRAAAGVIGTGGAQLSGLLDLARITGGDATASPFGTTATGDKIALHKGDYGFGVQTGTLVAYLPAASKFAVRPAAASAQASSGADAFSVSGTGVVIVGGASLTMTSGFYRATRALTSDGAISIRAGADASDRLNVEAGGRLLWGDGTAAPDTVLYRSAVSQLATDDGFFINTSLGLGVNTAPVAGALVNLPSTITVATGGILWGTDTNLYRNGPDSLKTDDDFQANTLRATGTSSAIIASNLSGTSSGALFIRNSAATAYRFQVNADGMINWGDGTLAQDTNLYRVGANVLGTDDTFRVIRAATSDNAFETFVTGEATRRFVMEATGRCIWGDGTAFDVQMYRQAANVLRLDDNFNVNNPPAQGFTATGKNWDNATAQAFYATNGAATQDIYMSAQSTWSSVGTTKTTFMLETSGATRMQITNTTVDVLSGVTLTANNNVRSRRASTALPAFQADITSESGTRFAIDSTGIHTWGDGTAAVDTNLYRSATDVLKTDDAFHVGAAFRHLGTTLGFYNATAVAQSTGWGAALATNFSGATSRKTLTATATLNDVIDVLATFIDATRNTGLVGA